MNFDKRISRLLAKSLLVPLSISCFGFCFTSAMEDKLKKNEAGSKKFLEKKRSIQLSKEDQQIIEILEMIDRAKKIKKKFESEKKTKANQEAKNKAKEDKRKKDEQKKINQCIKRAISSEGSEVAAMLNRCNSADYNERAYLFAQNVTQINVKTMSNIISNLRELNEKNPLTKDSPASLLLNTIEEIEKTIPKPSVLPLKMNGDKLTDDKLKLLDTILPDEQFNLFNENLKAMIKKFLGTYKCPAQDHAATSLLKTLNILPAGTWAMQYPEKVKARAKKCIHDAIYMLSKSKSIIDLKEEEKK